MDTNVPHVENYKVVKMKLMKPTKRNQNPSWEEGWYSKTHKYGPIKDFSDFECIQEITVWDKMDNPPPSHTYVLNRGGCLVGYFPRNDYDNFIYFGHSIKQFSKSHRKWKKVTI